MRPESELTEELPALPVDDTPTPPHVLAKVEELRAQGKKVIAKIPYDEYLKLLQLPHEERLAYALKVLLQQEKSQRARVACEGELRKRRALRANAAKRARAQRRKKRR